MANINTPKAHIVLKNRILSNQFKEAKEMIDAGSSYTVGLLSETISKENYEAFEFVLKEELFNLEEIRNSDLYSAFVNNKDNRFREFFVQHKDNLHIKELLATDYHINWFLKSISNQLGWNNIECLQPDNPEYSLEMDLSDVNEINEGIKLLIKDFENFNHFRQYLTPLSNIEELKYRELYQKVMKQKEIYENYMVTRLDIAEELKPLYEQKEKLNKDIENRIKELSEKFRENETKSQIKPN